MRAFPCISASLASPSCPRADARRPVGLPGHCRYPCSFGAVPALHQDLAWFCAAGIALPHRTAPGAEPSPRTLLPRRFGVRQGELTSTAKHRNLKSTFTNCCHRAEHASGCFLGIQPILPPALCRAAQAMALLQEQHFPVAEVKWYRGSWLTESPQMSPLPPSKRAGYTNIRTTLCTGQNQTSSCCPSTKTEVTF